jgi:hypothetical protein
MTGYSRLELKTQRNYTFIGAGQQADRHSGLLGGVCRDKPMYMWVCSAMSACMRLEQLQAGTDLGGTTQPGRQRDWFPQKRQAGLCVEPLMPGSGGSWSCWPAVW